MEFNLPILSDEVLWGVAVWKLCLALVIIFIGFLSRGIIKSIFTGSLKRRSEENDFLWDDDLIKFMPGPLAMVVQIAIWFGAVFLFEIPEQVAEVPLREPIFRGLLIALIAALMWVSFALIDVFSRFFLRRADQTESKLDDQLIPLVRKSLKVFIAIVLIVMVIEEMGGSVTSLLASLGIGGLALALAAQDTVANFFGSIVVFTDKPFRIGDFVSFTGVEGTVEEIGFRTTRIRTPEKTQVTVPNQTFTSNAITNLTERPFRRLKMTVGLSYETSAEEMTTFLERCRMLLEDHPQVNDEGHMVYLEAFGPSSLDVMVYCFSLDNGWEDWMKMREALMLEIMQLVADMNLELAFPTQTIYFRDEQWKTAPPSA